MSAKETGIDPRPNKRRAATTATERALANHVEGIGCLGLRVYGEETPKMVRNCVLQQACTTAEEALSLLTNLPERVARRPAG